MAKFSNHEKALLVEDARRLYVKGFDFQTISDFLSKPGKEVSQATLKAWSKENDFERSKRGQAIQRQEILNAIIESFQHVKEGGTPTIKALEAAQYAAAVEKLSDKSRLLMYMMEAYDELTDEMLRAVEKARAKKEKTRLFNIIKEVRTYGDKVVERLNQEVFV